MLPKVAFHFFERFYRRRNYRWRRKDSSVFFYSEVRSGLLALVACETAADSLNLSWDRTL